MVRCLTCSADAPYGSRFCSSCGAPFDPSLVTGSRTEVDDESPIVLLSSGASDGADTSRPPVDRSGFVPGTVLDKRYRIVGLLGRGGMGEVYRADDLKLGQPVALKFLRGLDRDASRLNRFLNEVRTARQVTHSNVCRVYDIGDAPTESGRRQHYLSMEYVDGEDLSSLLRRIGRLPPDKAMQIARQLCAGVQAAHEQGILHRDLKPANVMIDGRGQVKITDFGLAGLEATFGKGEIRSGTPAYMAPEQLAGQEVTVRSDIYALGLVLYELFTGKPAFDASTPSELIRLQQSSVPTNPSSHVENLDPSVERAILRCLKKQPSERPSSVLALAAALPGGDPLAAALAAGETPSPEMVADAGDVGGLRPVVALVCVVLALAGLVAVAKIQEKATLVGRVSLEKSPQLLVAEAREIIRAAGYEGQPVDKVHGFMRDSGYLQHRIGQDPAEDLSSLRPSPIQFWFRQSPRHLVATPNTNNLSVSWSDPALTTAGEIRVRVDPRGRLVSFEAVPTHRRDAVEGASEPDWSRMFASAGLEPGDLAPTEPHGIPLRAADRRAAWKGTYPDQPAIPIRVEAGSFRGRPVYFQVIPPWAEPDPATSLANEGKVWQSVLVLTVILGAGLLARRNLRLGRGDRRGAFRLASTIFTLLMFFWAVHTNHVPSLQEIWLNFIPCAGIALWWSILFGLVLWIALEPFVRRQWPESLISWGRLLGGRFRDPMVGRDLLVGTLAGVTINLLGLLPHWLGRTIDPGNPVNLDLAGGRQVLAVAANNIFWSLVLPLLILIFLLLLRMLLRKRWLAALACVLFFSLPTGLLDEGPLAKVAAVVAPAILLFVLLRFGYLAVCVTVAFAFTDFNVTLDFSKWYAGQSVVILGVVAALVLYGSYLSLAGRSLFSEDFLEAETVGSAEHAGR